VATGVAGEEITPLENVDFDSLALTPAVAAGANSQVVTFNNSYGIWVDNADNGGGSGTRMWIDMPNLADFVLGPRSGGSIGAGFRFRTNKTTASAANMFINSSTYEIARSTSSLKYKRDVETAELDLDALRQLRPVRYRDRSEVEAWERWQARRAADPDLVIGREAPPEPRTYVGLIAEEVDALGLSGFVQYDQDSGKPDGLMYDRIIVGALALIQDQASRIDRLEERLEALEAKA
jgi:hypothetical protein